jgi:hypothetical protein
MASAPSYSIPTISLEDHLISSYEFRRHNPLQGADARLSDRQVRDRKDSGIRRIGVEMPPIIIGGAGNDRQGAGRSLLASATTMQAKDGCRPN